MDEKKKIDKKKKIIIVAGPTASGKTALGIELAKALDGEIISADSMQVYKGMPVATACPNDFEKKAVPHHLVEFLDSSESFSVAHWCELARQKAEEILSRNKTPIIVGGTGLFIDSFADNIQFEDVDIDNALRNELMQKDENTLYDMLVSMDKEAAECIHKNNKKRVVRALELCLSGVTKTEQNINSKKARNPYEILYFVLAYENRQTLYDRINLRVEKMLEAGLVEEAKANISKIRATSAQAIGHKELIPYINGEISLQEATDNLKKETRHYAKRQITWFKRRKNAVFLIVDTMTGEELINTAVCKSEDFLND